MDNISEKRCGNCRHWNTNDHIAKKYDEGYGYCSRNKDYFFCDHQAMCFTSNPEIQSIEEDTKVEVN